MQPAKEEAEGATDVYMWGDRSIAFHRCKICGCVTHWAPVTTQEDHMGVNTRSMAPEVLALDGAASRWGGYGGLYRLTGLRFLGGGAPELSLRWTLAP